VATPLVENILKQTVGTQYFSQRQLTEMGHPYRINGGEPPTPRGVVNTQSRRFYDSLSVTGPLRVGNRIEIRVVTSDSERAAQLDAGGDSKMVPRPWQALIRSRMRRSVTKVITKEMGHVFISASREK